MKVLSWAKFSFIQRPTLRRLRIKRPCSPCSSPSDDRDPGSAALCHQGLSASDPDPESLLLPPFTQIPDPEVEAHGPKQRGAPEACSPLQRDRSRAPPPQRRERQPAAPMRAEQRGGATARGGANAASHLPAPCPAAWKRPPSFRPGRIPAA